MKRIVVVLAAALTLSACAKDPDNIAAVNIGQNEYRGYSCSQLRTTELKYNQALANLSAQQKDAQAGDAFGVFLLGLPLASMGGADKETQIAVTKGHLQAIELELARKNCR